MKLIPRCRPFWAWEHTSPGPVFDLWHLGFWNFCRDCDDPFWKWTVDWNVD
jgi:hypothetical protein